MLICGARGEQCRRGEGLGYECIGGCIKAQNAPRARTWHWSNVSGRWGSVKGEGVGAYAMGGE